MNGDFKVGSESGSDPLKPRESRKSRDPLVGTTLDGRFEIEEVLGTGGMSVVYKARQLRVNRYVAIKTIKMQLDSKPVYRERFQREINTLCSLSHPNIVTVYDCLIGEDDQPYVVMDYLKGRSLELLIAEDGPLSVERFARIAVQVCSALEHAHKNGVVHRDLKPGNVVLIDDETDIVKVVDFGLAKIGNENRKLTQSGELWGSPPYMSPEQAMGKSGDERSDIYSMGIVMFEMLAGKDPFHTAASVYELIQCHTVGAPPSINSINPSFFGNSEIERVIFKALEKEPDARYQTASELRQAIVEAAAGGGARNSGDLMLQVTGSGGRSPSGQNFVPAGGTGAGAGGSQGVSASAMFRRALDPMAGDDLSISSAFAPQLTPPAGGAPASSAGNSAPASVPAPAASTSASSPASQPPGRIQPPPSLRSMQRTETIGDTKPVPSGGGGPWKWIAIGSLLVLTVIVNIAFMVTQKGANAPKRDEEATHAPAPTTTPPTEKPQAASPQAPSSSTPEKVSAPASKSSVKPASDATNTAVTTSQAKQSEASAPKPPKAVKRTAEKAPPATKAAAPRKVASPAKSSAPVKAAAPVKSAASAKPASDAAHWGKLNDLRD